MMKLIAVLAFILMACTCEAKEYNIEELIKIAQQNSANIKSADYLARSQKRFSNQQKYWDNPTAEFNKIGNQKSYTLSQKVPFYGKLQNLYEAQRAQYQALEARKSGVELFVKAEIFRIIYRYRALKEMISLTKKRLDRLSLVDRYLAKIVMNSPTKRAQRHITKDRIRLVKRDLINLKNDLFQTFSEANIYLNLPEEPTKVSLEWLSSANYKGRKYFLEAALRNNLEIKEQKFLIKKSKSELSYAKIEQMPDVNLSFMRQDGTNEASVRNFSESGVGLAVSIPLWNQNKEQIAAKYSNVSAKKAELEFKKQQLKGLINNDINEYEASLQIAHDFPIKDIKSIISRLNRANASFKKGVLDFITYLELDAQEYQTVEAIMAAQINLAQSYAKLMMKTGEFIMPQYAKQGGNDE